MLLHWFCIAEGAASVVGCLYLICAAMWTARFARGALAASSASMPNATILKPLHGVETGLLENLASFCTQDYGGAIQIILGVEDRGDDAIAVVQQLRDKHPNCRLDLVVDATMHGLNRKVSNLINMSKLIEHEVVVVADSDIRVDRDYLVRVVSALEQSGVGAVTCLYHGIPETGFWSRLAALGINAHFLPNVIMGLELKLAYPCLGSTIALKGKTLADIGGFGSVADCLVDDYAIGVALRGRGYQIAVLPITVGHICADLSAREFWHREVRWARTIRSIDAVGYAGSLLAHAFPLALLAALGGTAIGTLGPVAAFGLCIASLACRLALMRQVRRAFALPSQSSWLLPLRDLVSFAVFLSSLLGRNASWRGYCYRFMPGGTLVFAGGRPTP